MQDFLMWLEAKSSISILSHNSYGEIGFEVNGKKYVYLMDAGFFKNGFFKNWMRYAPGKAFNFAKENGELIHPRPNPPSPESSKEKSKPVQRPLFPY